MISVATAYNQPYAVSRNPTSRCPAGLEPALSHAEAEGLSTAALGIFFMRRRGPKTYASAKGKRRWPFPPAVNICTPEENGQGAHCRALEDSEGQKPPREESA